jgi:hypothetical protein
MLNISMPNGITKGRTMSCCSLAVQTPAATGLFNAASDWAACCVITIRRQRNGVPKNYAHKGRETGATYAGAYTGAGRVAGCGSSAPTLSCACFCECNSQQPRTKMGKSAMRSCISPIAAHRGPGRERFPLPLQFFDPTATIRCGRRPPTNSRRGDPLPGIRYQLSWTSVA